MDTQHLVLKIYAQALSELPQIEDKNSREEALKQYINDMSNTELLDLIGRTESHG